MPKIPGNSPGFWIPREISLGVGRGIRLPGESPGKSVAPDCGSIPCEVIAIKSGISARCRRSGGPHPQVMTRRGAIPDSPRVGAGVSGPRESAWARRYRNFADCARRFSGFRTPRFSKPWPIGAWWRPSFRALIEEILLTRLQRSQVPGDRSPNKGEIDPLIRDQCPTRGPRKLAMGAPRFPDSPSGTMATRRRARRRRSPPTLFPADKCGGVESTISRTISANPIPRRLGAYRRGTKVIRIRPIRPDRPR